MCQWFMGMYDIVFVESEAEKVTKSYQESNINDTIWFFIFILFNKYDFFFTWKMKTHHT